MESRTVAVKAHTKRQTEQPQIHTTGSCQKRFPTFQFYYYKVHIPGIPNVFSMNVPEFVDG